MNGEFTEINITPFTDVLLVLLVIFMILAALVVPPGFERRLGSACERCIVDPPKVSTALVAIAKDGTIAVNGTRTSEQGLYGIFGRIAARDARTKVQLVADTRARYALVIRVLDAAKAAHITDVSFVTQ